jgi:hypothetical protein
MWALHEWFLIALAQFGVELYLYRDRILQMGCHAH